MKMIDGAIAIIVALDLLFPIKSASEFENSIKITVITAPSNKKAIEEYIRNQLAEDKQYEQLTMNELIDPFTGEPGKKGK